MPGQNVRDLSVSSRFLCDCIDESPSELTHRLLPICHAGALAQVMKTLEVEELRKIYNV